MALKEYYLGTVGPLYIDDTDPLFVDPQQVATKADVADVAPSGYTGTLLVAIGIGPEPTFDFENPVTLTFTKGLLTSVT